MPAPPGNRGSGFSGRDSFGGSSFDRRDRAERMAELNRNIGAGLTGGDQDGDTSKGGTKRGQQGNRDILRRISPVPTIPVDPVDGGGTNVPVPIVVTPVKPGAEMEAPAARRPRRRVSLGTPSGNTITGQSGVFIP